MPHYSKDIFCSIGKYFLPLNSVYYETTKLTPEVAVTQAGSFQELEDAGVGGHSSICQAQ